MGANEDLRQFWVSVEVFANYTCKLIALHCSDLGLLKRDRALQKRYDVWAEGIKREYGSMGRHCYDRQEDSL